MKIQITVTKEIYRRSMMCGTPGTAFISKSCAIALAARDIAPNAIVEQLKIIWDSYRNFSLLPNSAVQLITAFDRLKRTPHLRLNLPELSFEVDFPDELVDKIGIQEVNRILETSETLKPVGV